MTRSREDNVNVMTGVVGVFMGLVATIVMSTWLPWFVGVGLIVGLGFVVHLGCTRHQKVV